ncbi:partitioning defective 6 homolog gamma-like [Pteropus medius]|uniref:partitioning defective 6 homolog gamma-like n=1 Tax=Pteropus vampyrus TaxID=132908 RepID=UPI00196ACEBE|nr:partitioning defective 6 homolog gamma-like [Pteropus giganteus]
MNRSFHKSQTLRFYDCSAVEVKSKFGAEFRRFSLDRQRPGKFEDFYKLVVHTHHIANTEVTIGYADVHGDLLPINNDDNFCKAVSSANPLLRVFIQNEKRERDADFPLPSARLPVFPPCLCTSHPLLWERDSPRGSPCTPGSHKP